MTHSISHHRLIRGIGILYCSTAIGFTLPLWNVAFAQSSIGIPEYSGRDLEEHPILSPCSRYGDVYENLGFQETKFKDWPEFYHNKVNEVIEEYFEPEPIDCSASTYDELLKPGGALLDLGASMPTWNDPEVRLTRLDTGRVLLEFLRIYECALMEYGEFQYNETIDEETEEQGDDDDDALFDLFILYLKAFARTEIVAHEREISRATLHRVLSLMGAFDRLRPLEVELECMQRFSLDLRNISALTAEASACLPRIWQTKDVLRDIPFPSAAQ